MINVYAYEKGSEVKYIVALVKERKYFLHFVITLLSPSIIPPPSLSLFPVISSIGIFEDLYWL